MSSAWIFVIAARGSQGNARLDKLTVLERFRHDNRLKYWCKQHPQELIYVLAPIISVIGFEEFKVTVTRHRDETIRS